ncbi:hypothetical protein FRC04_011764 [Tulasnella sp. 424]|nr:hypothetical protein FRC04_011764 [Tulasnella sp. 424]KAG8978108.1 hypothetical protein FRC05_011224 [Tulasnella sp. 425]
MSPIPKKRKLETPKGDESESSDDQHEGSGLESGSDSGSDTGSASSVDTETEIALSHLTNKSKKTSKRKRRAVSPTPFGQTLTALLETSTATSQPLALRPSIAQKKNEEKLEMRAKKLLQAERKKKEDIGRVKDVIGGWGGESERTLRKVAQRGVVKLFNVIQQVQATETGDGSSEDERPRRRGFGKKRHQEIKQKQKQEEKVALGQDDFMKMIRSGGVVSKA